MRCCGLFVDAVSVNFDVLVVSFSLIVLFMAGRIVRSWRFIKIVAGTGFQSGNGVVQSASSAKYGSLPLWNAFLRVFLTV